MTVENDAHFPSLKAEGWRKTSEASAAYNCIAYAAGDERGPWWPQSFDAYWPGEAANEETVEAFIEAFGTLGYGRSKDGTFEDGWEKVALYARGSEPTHAARQVGKEWRSKLGPDEDVAHTLAGLEGPLYGKVVAYLQRKQAASTKTVAPPPAPEPEIK